MPDYVSNIRKSQLTIYDQIEIGDPDLWIPSPALEEILNRKLRGKDVSGMPLRTRSKKVNEWIAEALGYPVPSSFQRTEPRFPGQNFDKYTQKSSNLQVWNQGLDPARRYVIIDITDDDVIRKVRVVSGDVLAELDTTNTLTGKYQARLVVGETPYELVSKRDTSNIQSIKAPNGDIDLSSVTPIDYPERGDILPIDVIFERLKPLVGRTFEDPGFLQDRNRGGLLHKMICRELGFGHYADDGSFPDISHQILEVKLQTSPTIDLGIALPDNDSPIDFPKIGDKQILHRDVRYALFYGDTDGAKVELTNLLVTTGEDFFERFEQFGGKTLNEKSQIRLPSDFFD